MIANKPSIARPVGEVFRSILDNLQDIVRSEARLAKAEFREDLVKSRVALVWIGIAALSGVFACGYALLCGFLALCHSLPDWASAAIIAAVSAAICAFSVATSRRARASDQARGPRHLR
jgi:hypothetical protein